MRENLQIVSHGRRWGSAVAALMVLAACGSSSHRYLANREREGVSPRAAVVARRQAVRSVKDPLLQATSDAKIISK